MEWDHLKLFLAVARSGSLTEAGRVLNTSPATVGRGIAALESKLGARLFDRNQTGYALTDSGKAIRAKAEQVEAAVLTVEQEALGRDLRTSGKVRVATTDDIATLIIAPKVSEFRRRFPGIALEIVARQEVASLTRREADIALRPIRPRQASLLVRQVGVWKLGLYAARKYAEAHDLRPGRRDFSDIAIIEWTKEGAVLRSAPWFAKNAPGSVVALTASSRRIHHAACKSGIGVAILPSLAADHDPDLVCLLPPDQVISVPLWLVVHRDLARTARVRAVMEFLTEACSKAGH
jgi:DNA-binding transcriptional LysR family regulator